MGITNDLVNCVCSSPYDHGHEYSSISGKNQKHTEDKGHVPAHVNPPALNIIVHFCSRDQEILINVLVHSVAIIEAHIHEDDMSPRLNLPDEVSLSYLQ